MSDTNSSKTTNLLIEESFELIGKFANDKNLNGTDFRRGLRLLNMLLDSYSARPDLIGYNQILEFPLIVGKKEYIISKDESLNPDVIYNQLIQPRSMQLLLGSMKYPVDLVEDMFDYNVQYPDNVSGRPIRAYFQNSPGATNLIFLVNPHSEYICKIKGKFAFNYLSQNEDITGFPDYFYLFLQYALARMLKNSYIGSSWDAGRETAYNDLLQSVQASNDMNLNVESGDDLTFRNRQSNYYNFGYAY